MKEELHQIRLNGRQVIKKLRALVDVFLTLRLRPTAHVYTHTRSRAYVHAKTSRGVGMGLTVWHDAMLVLHTP